MKNPMIPNEIFKLPDALARLIASLDRVSQDLVKLRQGAPTRRAEPEPVHYFLNQSKTSMTIPIAYQVTGLFIGGDAAGKGVLQVGQQFFPFWVPSYETIYYQFAAIDPIIIRNDQVTWTPPTGGTNWDVTLSGRAIPVDMSGAAQRV